MLSTILKKITEGTLYCGLEIVQAEHGETYCFIQLKKTVKELLIVKCIVLDSLEEVSQHLNTNTPLFICINTTGVLSKQLEHLPSAMDAALVNEAFPNLDTRNFYWELTQKSSRPIVSIARKDYVDVLLQKLEEMKLSPFQVSLGISGLHSITPYLTEKRIRLSKYTINLDESSDMTIATATEPFVPKDYIINGLSISNRHMLSFAQILGYLNPRERITNLIELNTVYITAFKNQRLFHNISRSSLIFFVGILLINFLFYHYYFERVSELKTEVLVTGSKKEQLLLLEASVQKKQERLELFTTTFNSRATQYLDRFAQQVPESILLDQINYQPLVKTIQESKPIELNRQVVLISGISKDINAFSKWVELLEKNDLIQSVETLDYDYVTKETSNFLIEIQCYEN